MRADAEHLLRSEGRAALPLWRQCVLYLDPFALFKDASRGPLKAREQALSYNRAMRWMLLAYVRRWAAIAAGLLAVPAAAAAVGACVALTVLAVIGAVYVLLGSGD